jgi:hypothetical protein
MLSVTKGGSASGPDKCKYTLYNKSRKKNDAGEHLHTIFRCGSHENSSHEVSPAYEYEISLDLFYSLPRSFILCIHHLAERNYFYV